MNPKLKVRQVIRWTFIGPLFGVALASPLIWYFASPFDHSLSVKAFWMYLIALPFAYMFGLPAALMTGLAYLTIRKRVSEVKAQHIQIIAAGACSSTYLVWLALLSRVGDSAYTYTWDWIPSALFLMIIGGLSTLCLLLIERNTTSKNFSNT